MPKSQQVILAILLVLIGFNIFLPIIGAIFQIEILEFGSIFIKILDSITLLIAIIFVYRQIKRKGF
ncbi:hypothetical protein ACQ23P_09525 [Staphylococcus cohnii]|uniref:hypothetical protein n=1 Tax=Staphylococcus TaxID=1279 RepID=UPI000D1CBE8F|nr:MULTISPECIES: hypothetical protein [Staphylococcus]PTE76261.1 hypothetical protein BUY38_10825 [Staphylococcus cohnii]PTF33403.1 hypothetical protein BUY25_12645 [Staphylococcus cohnii]RIL74594.1 hypothetical protein BUY37_09580 [Staphylococcus cohnii]WIL69575.1 hypothetical protein QMK35_12805 [Staphylococcus cohnii]